MASVEQKYFKNSWLLPCSLTPHRQPSPKNRLRHFSALPTRHPNTRERARRKIKVENSLQLTDYKN